MKLPVFLSHPTPHRDVQRSFIEALCKELAARNINPVSLGAGGYDWSAPLVGIRRLMANTCGLVGVAFRRTYIASGCSKEGANIEGVQPRELKNAWVTSPYSHIEPAMAFQLGLPILIMREAGVLEEGVLEKGVTGLYMPEFDAESGGAFLQGTECQSLLSQWAAYVRTSYERRGDPPRLF